MPSYSSGATGVPASYKYPAVLLALALGANAASIGGQPLKILCVGNKTSAGSMTADTQVAKPVSVDDAVALAGTGSELALMATAALSIPGATVHMLAQAEPAGTKAAATLTIATTATGTGNFYLWIHGVLIVTSVVSGQNVATISQAIQNQIAAKTALLGVTSSVNTGTGVITITWRHNGTRGNACTLRKAVDSSVTGTTFTLSAATLTSGTGGADSTNAIATAAAGIYHRIAVATAPNTAGGSTSTENADLVKWKTHLGTMGGPLVGRREQLVFCTTDSLGAATTTVQTNLNEPLMQALFHPGAEDIPGVVAAGWASARSVAEAANPAVNESSWNPTLVNASGYCKPQSDASLYLSNSSAASALDVGLTPIQVAADGTTFIVRSITTHSQDASGNPDWRVLDTVNVTVPQRWADLLSVDIPTTFAGKNIVDDPLDSDDELPPTVTTPSAVKSHCIGLAQSEEKLGHLQQVETDTALWAFNLAGSTSPGRVNADMQIHPAQWFVQFSANVRSLAA